MPKLSGAFAALEIGTYRRMWSGSLLATSAFMMSFLLVPSVAFDISGSNAAAGFAQMGSGLAMLTISPIGGVIADRMRKKPLVLAGQIVPAVVILCTGLLILTDNITVPLLTAATLIMGLGFAFMGPARQAWVAELVPKEMFPNAVALQQIAQSISQVLAPLSIAVLVGTIFDVGAAYLFMASLFVIVLPLTLSLPSAAPPPKEPASIGADLAQGVAYVWNHQRLRTLWLGFVAMVVCGFAFQTLLPGLLAEELGREPSDVGVIFLVLALAGLVVNVPLAAVVRTNRAWPTMLAMGALMAVGFVLLSVAPSYGLVILAGVPLGIGRSGFMLLDNALLMAGADPAYHGRVMSLAMVGFGSQALLAPVWGAIADAIGVRNTLFIVGLVTATLVAWLTLAWLATERRIRRADLAPALSPGLEPT